MEVPDPDDSLWARRAYEYALSAAANEPVGQLERFGYDTKRDIDRVLGLIAKAVTTGMRQAELASPEDTVWQAEHAEQASELLAALAAASPEQTTDLANAAGDLLRIPERKAILQKIADGVRRLDPARWTPHQRLARAAALLVALGMTIHSGTAETIYTNITQALIIILALATLLPGEKQ